MLMTWFWLLLAGVWQPLAMEAYRWAPHLAPDDIVLARLYVREVSLMGPVLVLVPLAVVPIEYETRACNRIRKWALLVALGMLVLAVQLGLERNLPYRVTFLAQQVLMAATWWCAILGERRARHRVAHSARLAGFLFACLGVGLCLLSQFALSWDSMLGTVPEYDPYAETASLASVLRLCELTAILILGSLAAVPFLQWSATRWRGLHAVLMRLAR